MVKEQIIGTFNENKKRYDIQNYTRTTNNDICVNQDGFRTHEAAGLVCQGFAQRKYNSYKGEVGEVAPNLLERHFQDKPQIGKWVMMLLNSK